MRKIKKIIPDFRGGINIKATLTSDNKDGMTTDWLNLENISRLPLNKPILVEFSKGTVKTCIVKVRKIKVNGKEVK